MKIIEKITEYLFNQAKGMHGKIIIARGPTKGILTLIHNLEIKIFSFAKKKKSFIFFYPQALTRICPHVWILYLKAALIPLRAALWKQALMDRCLRLFALTYYANGTLKVCPRWWHTYISLCLLFLFLLLVWIGNVDFVAPPLQLSSRIDSHAWRRCSRWLFFPTSVT